MRGTPEGTNEFSARPLRSEPKVAWDLKTPYRDSGALVASERVLITGNINGKGGTFAYDAGSGKKLWSKPGQMRGAPTIDGGFVYVVNDIGKNRFRLAKLAVASGKQQWAVEAEDLGHGDAAPLVIDGRVFLVSRDQSIAGYDAASGKQLWRQTKIGICSAALVAGGGHIYFSGSLTGTAGGITVLEPDSGKATAFKLGSGGCGGELALQNGTLVTTVDGVLTALDAGTGAVRWQQKLTYQERGFTKTTQLGGEPTITGGNVYVQSPLAIYGFDLKTGRQVFELALGRNNDRMIATGGVLYIGSDANDTTERGGAGWVSAIDLATKQVLWRFRARQPDKYNSDGKWPTRFMLPVDDGLYLENESRLVKLSATPPAKPGAKK
jgi:outer membrane protein assembly factor BamB